MTAAVRLSSPRPWASTAIPSTRVTWNSTSSTIAACQMVSPVTWTRAAVAACRPGYRAMIEMIGLGWKSLPVVRISWVSRQCAYSSW